MAIPDLTVTEDYADLTKLTQDQLNDAMTSIESYCNTNIKLNIEQFALDVFSDTYDFNNDGIQTRATPLVDSIPTLEDNETINGSWTFENTVGFNDTVTATSLVNITGQSRCKAYRSTSSFSIATATITAIEMNAESYDTGSMHDNAVSNTRITIPAAAGGMYLINAQVTFGNSATGRREVHIYKNNALFATVKEFGPDGTENTVLQINAHDNSSGGDYYDVRAYQNTGGALNILSGEAVTFFSMAKVA